MAIDKEVQVSARYATNVVLDFAAPTFIAPHRLRFRFRLEGAETAWSETQSRRLRFERLPRGKHRLTIQAFHPGTDYGPPDETSILIELLTPWHQRVPIQVAFVSIFGVGVVNWMRRRSRRRHESDTAIVAERARIAHEIHDRLEQDLCGLRLQIQAAGKALEGSPKKAQESLERAAELVSDASEDLRTAIWKLQLDATDSSELLRAIEQRLRRATAGTEVSLHAHPHGPAKTLPIGVASHLEAITREAVANILKYASATKIQVVFDTNDPKRFLLDVSDNGKGKGGFQQEPQTGSGGLGISGMRARARAMNGTLQILHPETGGTIVRLCIPLRSGISG